MATIPVTSDLATITTPPDIIHGQHTHELLAALLRFPGTPAVRVCHGWLDDPPHPFPRVLRYVAVDETTRDRYVYEWGVPAEKVQVLLNWVDLQRFTPRSPLPQRPARALVFSHNARDYLHEIRNACAPLGIEVDAVGDSLGNAAPAPERLLQDYDIVFAKARAAMEAMASGAAVILCDTAGLGPMVTSDEFARLRRFNFGIRTLQQKITLDGLQREIKCFDPDDAREVTRRLRAEPAMDAGIESLIDCYREVIAESRHMRSDPVAELRSASTYLQRLSPQIHPSTPADTGYHFLRSLYFWAAHAPGLRALAQTSVVTRLARKVRDRRRLARV
jgi:hypothetical protein